MFLLIRPEKRAWRLLYSLSQWAKRSLPPPPLPATRVHRPLSMLPWRRLRLRRRSGPPVGLLDPRAAPVVLLEPRAGTKQEPVGLLDPQALASQIFLLDN